VKRFLVLAGDSHYPAGWDDYQGSFDTLEEALVRAEAALPEGWGHGFRWFHVVDTVGATIVRRSQPHPHSP